MCYFSDYCVGALNSQDPKLGIDMGPFIAEGQISAAAARPLRLGWSSLVAPSKRPSDP